MTHSLTTAFSTGLLIFGLSASIARGQDFSCEIENGGGVTLYGTNLHDRVVRCEVKCSYWKPDGAEGFQNCTLQMQPMSYDVKYCAWNLNDASQIIGVSQVCQ